LRRPISLLVESLPPAEPAVVPSQLSIEAALDAALARASGHVYDPLIVDSGDALHLLEIEVLMRAAAAALTAANREKDWLLGELQRTGS
ncbi:MAG: hypothetical protein JO164_02455, partial [Candidatus Eremiobacteraeota bacterium]|nr:hypothetical protein [Candidatus Eremiobacteraeota bacterium]